MSTQVFLRNTTASLSLGGTTYDLLGHQDASNSNNPRRLNTGTGRGASSTTNNTNTVTGPVAAKGLENTNIGAQNYRWETPPLSADATISGTVTFNFWASENNMAANAGLEIVVERHQPDGTVSTIVDSEFGTELATAAAVNNWTATPTSTACKAGDWLVVRVFFNDAGGTMASGSQTQFSWNGGTAAAAGDTFVTFTENLTFASTDATGSALNLLNTASDLGGAGQKKLWTDSPAGAVDCVTNTVANTSSDAQVTATAGGTALSWITPKIAAVTLSGFVKCDLYGLESSASANATWRVKLETLDGTGGSAVVIADGAAVVELGTSAAYARLALATESVSVADGARLRVTVYQTSQNADANLGASGFTTTLKIEDVTNPSKVTFSQTLSLQSSGTPISDGDTATATDGGEAIALGPDDDPATVADAGESIVVQVSDGDTATATDGGESFAWSDADSGTAVDGGESLSIVQAVTDDQPAAAADAGESIAATPTDPETGTAADAGESIAGTVAAPETGTATDAGEQLAATLADVETGTAADLEGSIGLADTDPATGADAEAVAAALADPETGAALDGGESIAAPTADQDAATALEAGTVGASLADGEAGTGAETEALSATLQDPDAAGAVDAGEQVAASLADADPGTAVETESVDTGGGTVPISDSDAGTAVDAGEQLQAALVDPETAVAVDAEQATSTLADPDTGTAVEVEAVAAALAAPETGTAAETESVAPAVADQDQAAALEAGTVGAAPVDGESGIAVEAEQYLASLSDADAGVAVDSQSPPVAQAPGVVEHDGYAGTGDPAVTPAGAGGAANLAGAGTERATIAGAGPDAAYASASD